MKSNTSNKKSANEKALKNKTQKVSTNKVVSNKKAKKDNLSLKREKSSNKKDTPKQEALKFTLNEIKEDNVLKNEEQNEQLPPILEENIDEKLESPLVEETLPNQNENETKDTLDEDKKEETKKEEPPLTPEEKRKIIDSIGAISKKHKIALLITSIISVCATIAFLFIPFVNSIKPIDFFTQNFSELTNDSYIVISIFATLMITILISFYLFFDAFAHFEKKTFIKKINRVFVLNLIVGVAYGLAGFILLLVDLFGSKTGLICYSYILTFIQILVIIAISVIKSFYIPDYLIMQRYKDEETSTPREKVEKVKKPFPSIEQLVYLLIFTVLPIGVLFVDLFTVYVNGQVAYQPIKGIDFLTKMGTFTNIGYKIISFVFLIFLIADGVLLIASLVTFFAKRKRFYTVSICSIVINFCFVCFVSLYGLYYKIVQASTVENIQTLLEQFYPGSEPIIEVLKTATVETFSYIIAIASILVLLFILARNPSRFALLYEQLDRDEISKEELEASLISDEALTCELATQGGVGAGSNVGGGESSVLNNSSNGGASSDAASGVASTMSPDEEGPLDVNIVEEEETDGILKSFDACPAFTELDSKVNIYEKELKKRSLSPFKGKDLPSLVTFVVDYAKNSRLHLSYCKEDIAAFIAGLGCTRLTILQGMSGTGKTSLPKIFMEALYGTCELIEIESSWREKNELLGFYNEFSKMYTPKKFTQCLYKAALREDIITMIVLDEMNLSRIEYYFSDFLSLMENEENQRQIKLSNIKLYNIYDNKKHSYLKLVEDHTLKIPTNVWFIGTANRDESTFEISDKVYDRAHTMNFNKRAPAIKVFDEPMAPQFLKYDVFSRMLSNAIKNYDFDIEKNSIIKQVERIMAPFNISFGNRIYRQIENFVKVYCSCFPKPKEREFEAVETILLTKVVMKLENKNIDNRDALINEFKKLKLTRCVDFISKLSEDF